MESSSSIRVIYNPYSDRVIICKAPVSLLSASRKRSHSPVITHESDITDIFPPSPIIIYSKNHHYYDEETIDLSLLSPLPVDDSSIQWIKKKRRIYEEQKINEIKIENNFEDQINF